MLLSRRTVTKGLAVLAAGSVTPPCLRAAGAAVTTGPAAAAETPSMPTDRVAAQPAFPLAVSKRWRCLEDARGVPFLIQGDTPWSLIVQLTKPEVETYFGDRRSRGFNSLLVNLIEHHFARNAPANIFGEQPFLNGEPFGALNEAYFEHADWVLRRAAAHGFLVLLTPSYLGFGGDGEGWYQAMVAAGPEKLARYGRAVGRRYRDFTNIMWVHCGDFDPPDKAPVLAVAKGIRDEDGRALHTVHGGPETDVLDYWRGEPWIACGNVYTYGPVVAQAEKRFLGADRRPFFLIESAYENEHDATEQRLRTQAYQALLSGACGQFFGNNPIWAFGAQTAFDAPTGWRDALGSRGAQSMTHLHALFSTLPWWRLVPDLDEQFLQNGLGDMLRSGLTQVLPKRFGRWHERAVAAVDSERSFALAYLPAGRSVLVDVGLLKGPGATARWYDPAGGVFRPAALDRVRKDVQELSPPARNAAGFSDWVLLVEAQG